MCPPFFDQLVQACERISKYGSRTFIPVPFLLLLNHSDTFLFASLHHVKANVYTGLYQFEAYFRTGAPKGVEADTLNLYMFGFL